MRLGNYEADARLAEPTARNLMNADELDDGQIIEQVLAGDKQAFRFLVLRYQSQVFAMLMRQIAERDLAEELTQETFLRAYRELKSFRGEAKFSSWLIRIALNLSNSYFSSKRFKQRKQTESLEMENDRTTNETPHSRAERHEMLKRFRASLELISPKLREVMVLCGLEDRSYEEAAQILEIPVGTVRSRLNQARLEVKAACRVEELVE